MLGSVIAIMLASQPAPDVVLQDEYAIGASRWLDTVRVIPEACVAEIRGMHTEDAERRPQVVAGLIAGSVYKVAQSAEATEMVYDQHMQDTLERFRSGQISYGEVRRVQAQVSQLREEPVKQLRAYEARFPSCKFMGHLKHFRAVRRVLDAR